MNPILEILSQGEEIVTGQIADTNSAWLSQQAVVMGFNVARHTAVGDKLDDLVQVLREIASRADCCIGTGGLGPTSDDLTAEAVALAFGCPLEFDEVAYGQIQQFFANRQRAMPECNRKQALLPKGAVRLDNHWGTAPGFALQGGKCWFAFVPGVPSEMRQLFSAHIKPILEGRFNLRPNQLITIKSVGIGESDIQERIKAIEIPGQVQLGFRAEWGEVQTKLLFPGDYPQDKQDNLARKIALAIGDAVYAIEGLAGQSNDLVNRVDQMLSEKAFTLAIIETTSQGLLAAKLVGSPWLLSAVYERSLEKLTENFSVEHEAENLLTTARELAIALQAKSSADLVLVQLCSSQNSGSPESEKAITLTTILLAHGELKHTVRIVAGEIQRKQHQAALIAIDLLRRYLQGKAIA